MKKILAVSLLAVCGGMVAAGVGTKFANEATTVKAEDALSYIDKTLGRYDLQLGNNGTNRLTLNICVPADSGLDFAEGQDIRYAYNTDDGADSEHGGCHILQLAAEGETAATIKARTYLLNMFKGMILVDGEPLVDTKGSGTDVIRLWEYTEANHGRIILTRNADGGAVGTSNRLKISVDVCLPGFSADGKDHTVTMKRGLELPSMSYALNKDLGNTSKTTVYRTTNDITYKFNSSNIGTVTCVMSDESKEDIKVEDVGFGQLAAYSQTVAAGRYGFHFGLVAPGTKKGTTYYPDVAQYNVHVDPANSNYNCQDGALTNLKTWDYIEYNADPNGSGEWVSAKTKWTDSRLYSSAHKYFDSYNDFWFDLKLGTDAPSTVGIRLNKGMKIPTQLMIKAASQGDHTKNSYVQVNGTYTFTFEKGSDGQYVQSAISGGNELDLSEYCTETEVTGMKIYTGANNWGYASFALTEYDGEKKNFCYNNQYISFSGEFNGTSLITTDKGGFVAKTPSSSDVATRLYRMYVNGKECGFPMNYQKGTADFTTVTVPAGVRFPALSYIASNPNNADSALGETKKFYVTTKTVTLVKVAEDEYRSLDVIKSEAITELTNYFNMEDYREAEQAILAKGVEDVTTAINEADSYAAIQKIVSDTKADIDSLKTAAEYAAEELAAAKAAAKEEIEEYLDLSNYTMSIETIETLIAQAEAAIDECIDISILPQIVQVAEAKLDAVPDDQAFADALLASIAALPEPALSNAYLNAISSVITQINALTPECAALVGEAEIAKALESFADFKTMLYNNVVGSVNAALEDPLYTEENLQAIVACAQAYLAAIQNAEDPDTAVEAWQNALSAKDEIDYNLAYNFIGEVVTFFNDHVVEGYIVYELEDGEAIWTLVGKFNALAANADVAYYLVNLKIQMGTSKLTVMDLLNNYVIGPYYAVVEEEAYRIMDIVDEIPVQITLEDEEAILAAVEEINACTNDDVLEILEDEGYIEKAALAYSTLIQLKLTAAKEAALTELTNYFNLEDYRDAEKAILEEGIVSVTAAINAAKSIDEVNQIVASTKADIDSLKTAAEYEAEELAAAQVAAKAELEEYAAAKDASKYDEAGNAAIAEAVAAGKAAIDEAASEEAVASALEAAKAAIDAVEEYVAPAKKGCGSSVVAASALITLVSLLGAGLISAKRKHN